MDYKQAFLSQLENSYLGVQIQDAKDLFSQDLGSQDSGSQDSISKEAPKKSGFINLLQMKSKYFGHIKNLLEKEKLNHSIYTKLYNFFSSYLNETGTPFFYDTPMHKNIYAKVYTNSKDTSLFYKTQNLYYVKSDTLYHDAEITSQDSKYTFIFDTSHFIPNADNAKNKAIFKFTIEENIRIYVLNDKESLKELPNVFKQNSSDLSDEFIKSLKDKKIQLQEEIKKILSSYKKQNEIDFFIHKNARAFLQEQFNLWLCNYVLDDITQWKQEKIEELNTLKKVAFSQEWKNGELKNGKQVNPISIAFRYYELESYEEALENCEYMLDKDSIIDYRKSRKLIKGLKKGEAISLDMNGYREGFDILHTMANVLGLRIKRFFIDSKGIECAEFDNGGIVSSDNVDLCKYPKLMNLIWWEK